MRTTVSLGVGPTSITAELADALARLGIRADLEPMGGAA